jgi:hypothetical protein
MENIDPQQPIFIYDDETKTYNDIRNQAYKTTLVKGKNHNRFSLRFTDKTLGIDDNNSSFKDLTIQFSTTTNIFAINNNKTNMTIEKVTLFNIIGQIIGTWEVENQDQKNIQILFKNSSTGVYVAKIKTSTGIISKKIIRN